MRARRDERYSRLNLGDTAVLAAVLAVDSLEVVAAWPDVVDGALGGVGRREVVLFAEL